jgi:hypothetical protein
MKVTEEINEKDVDQVLKDLFDLLSGLNCWVDDGGDKNLFLETLPGGEMHLKHDLDLASSHLIDLMDKLLDHLLSLDDPDPASDPYGSIISKIEYLRNVRSSNQ